MPQFEVSGRGKDTGRKRKRKYNAENETEVRSIAESEGTIVDSIVELPPEPASEKQLEYAGILGITVPENPTKEELSYLISQKVDDPASEAQLYCFKQQGLQLGKYQYASSNNVVHAIKNKLGDNATHELARWYIYSVFRYIKKEKWQVPDNNLIQKEKTHGLAEKLISKEDIKKSLLRELEKTGYCFNIIPFKLDSNIDLSPASTRTKVFQEAEKIAGPRHIVWKSRYPEEHLMTTG